MNGYEEIIRGYLDKAWARSEEVLREAAPAVPEAPGVLAFPAFGRPCSVQRHGVFFDGVLDTGARGVLTAIYLAVVPKWSAPLHPLKAFKEIPNSRALPGRFRRGTPNSPWCLTCRKFAKIWNPSSAGFSGHRNTDAPSGDFSFTLYPLPKIPLYYIVHEADDEFPRR